MSDMFLTKEEVAELTGRKTKSKQVEQLRKMAIPFWLNAVGAPVIARSTIEGKPAVTPQRPKWEPNVLKKT